MPIGQIFLRNSAIKIRSLAKKQFFCTCHPKIFFSHFNILFYQSNFARNKNNCFFDKDLVLKAEFLKKNLTDWHESSHCCCHTITRTHLRTFSVIGDVYFTLFALKSPKTLLGIKRIVSLLKIVSWKLSLAKKSGWLTRVFTLLMSHNNLHASSNFFSHWRCLLNFICLKIPQNFARNKKNCIFAKDLILKAEFLKKIWLIDTSLHTVVVTQ